MLIATESMPDVTAIDRANATVDEDLFCIGCEYNLRTQPLGAACPECGRPVRATLEFPRLQRSAPRWLISLLDSVTVMIVSFVLDFAILMVGVRTESLALALAVVPWGLTWFAIWLLTRPEPGSLHAGERARAWTLRILATLPYMTLFLSTRPEWIARLGSDVLIGLFMCAGLAGWFYYDHLARSARRLPAPALAMQASLLRWIIACASVASVAQIWLLPGRRLAQALHLLPRPAMPGAGELSLIADVLIAGTQIVHPRVLGHLFIALATLAAVAVLIQFRMAFARAVRGSKQPRRG